MKTLSAFASRLSALPIAPSRRGSSPRIAGTVGSRPGFAMFMALGALVIIAVLIAGSSFITQQEARLGQNMLVQSRALAAAEYGLNKIQADWDRTPNLQMATGATFDTNYTITNQGTVTVRYVRLNNETFWIVSEGRATVGNSTSASRTAVKRVGAILRLRIPTIKANGAVTSGGTLTTGGNAKINGANTVPPGWTGCNAAPDKAAIVVSNTNSVSLSNQASKYITGSPQVSVDPLAADSNTYVRFGDETWNALVASANVTNTSGGETPGPTLNADGSCKKSDPANWGEPWRTTGYVAACINYFPIIYFTTSAMMHGGRGQGIMLVNGDMSANGQFQFYGLVIARDDVDKFNGTSAIYGAVMARNAVPDSETEDFTGTLDTYYSACSLERAMRGSAQVVQAKHRAWTELY